MSTRRRGPAFGAVWLLVAAWLVAFPGEAWPQAAWTADWAQIRAAAAKVTSLQARLVQRKYLAILREPLESRGRFAFARADRLRWEYESPIRQLTLVDGASIGRYVFDGTRFVPDAASSLQALRLVLDHVTRWLAGRFEDDPVFEASLSTGSPPEVVLVPKDPALAKTLRRVTLVPGDREGVLRRIEIDEPDAARTVLEFEDVRVNEPLPDALFRVEP